MTRTQHSSIIVYQQTTMLPTRFSMSSLRTILATTARYSSHTEGVSKKESYYKNLASEQDVYTNPERWDEALPFEKMPGPKPLPIIGNMWRFLPGGEYHNIKFDKLIESFPSRYGNVIRFGGIIGRREMVYVMDPEDMENVLRNSGPFPRREGMEAFSYYRNVLKKDVFQGIAGLLSTHGEDWYKIRTVVNPILMQPKIIQQYTTRMDNIAKDLIKCIRQHVKETGGNQTGEEFASDLYKWALESVAIVALNKRLGCLDVSSEQNAEVHKFMKGTLKMFDQMYYLDVLPPYWKFLPSKRFKEFVENMDFILSIVMKYIDEGLQDSMNENVPEDELGVLQRLAKIDKKVAFTMTVDMLMAGVDTTGKTIGAALYFLAKNPDKQNKLREEVLKFLPDKQSSITSETLSKMSYLKAVIKEVTRIAPIGVGNLRTTTKNMVVGGYQIPKGTNVITMHLYTNMTDEYFKEPAKFIPERWLRSTDDEYSQKNVHSFAAMPFGFGPRSCVGKRLANLELEVGLANIMLGKILTSQAQELVLNLYEYFELEKRNGGPLEPLFSVQEIIRNFDLSWQQPDMEFGAKLLYGFLDPLKLTVKELD